MMNNQTFGAGCTHTPTPTTTSKVFITEEAPKEESWRKVVKNIGDWFQYKNKEEWLKDMRGNLSLVASIIATLTFQSAINPPGGVFQANINDKLNETLNTSTGQNLQLNPGEAVLAAVFPDDYFKFLVWNTVCFIASLSVCLLLASGFPLNHRFPTWLLSIGMCITMTSLAFTYMYAAQMVTPDPIWTQVTFVFKIVLNVWIILMGIVGFVLVIHLCAWSSKKWNEKKLSSHQ